MSGTESRFPEKDLRRIRRDGASAWSDELFAEIMEAAKKLDGEYEVEGGAIARKHFWAAMLHVSRDTGLNRARLLNIKRSDITSDGRCVVKFTNPDYDRVFRLTSDTMRAIKRTFPPKRKHILPEVMTGQGMRKHWDKILRLAGIRPDLLLYAAGAKTRIVASFPPVENAGEGDDRLLLDFFEKLYAPLKLRGRSENTYRLYHYSIRAYGSYLRHNPLLSDLTDEKVSAYLADLMNCGRSVFTVEKERCQLLAVWRFAAQRQLLRNYPNVPRQPLPRLLHFAWMQEELRKLYASASRTHGNYCGVHAGDWWPALISLLWDTGERIGAIVQLRWKDIDLNGGWVLIEAALRKGKTADKSHKLSNETLEHLRKIRQPDRELILPWPYSRNYLYHPFGQILRRAGLPTDAKSKFHRIRRSVASHFEAAGGDATELLDHSSRSITKKHYIDPRIVKSQQASELLFPLGGDEVNQDDEQHGGQS